VSSVTLAHRMRTLDAQGRFDSGRKETRQPTGRATRGDGHDNGRDRERLAHRRCRRSPMRIVPRVRVLGESSRNTQRHRRSSEKSKLPAPRQVCELSSHRAGNHLRCEVRTLQSCCTAGGRCPGRRRRYLPRHVLPDAVLGQEHPDFEKIRPGVAPTHQRCAPSDTREPFFRR